MIQGVGANGLSDDRVVIIDGHICGLPGIGFGGYVAGLLAGELGVPAKVDFIRPVPLGVELSIELDMTGEARLVDGDIVFATGHLHETCLDHPDLPTWEAAEKASRAYAAMTDNEHPNCFGCGPAMPAGRGMRVFTGPIEGNELVAAAWSPSDASRDPTASSCPCMSGRHSTAQAAGPGGSSSRANQPSRPTWLFRRWLRFVRENPTSSWDGRYARTVESLSSVWRSST